ncbi:hypothetical protein BTA51_04910 [Hahella sp. CCB-MM4]|uniref:Ig-like domain-containing protein n=1 Tax=Hahella sp. (strain CCB-MM4) TaxID=1926491 RepID=UPI000B9BDD75|nr:Ig-like domain-containing protein [Hahella sp. CCB-MM4]OZG74355.1 hypothetical protein BTA51_04910 [Hahella sp. CCB-MM4]
MMQYVASFITTLILGLLSFSAFAKDFGPAQKYNAFVFDDFRADSSDVEGRLAVGGNIALNNYSVGDKLEPNKAGDVLVAGGNIVFPSGRVYHGGIVAGGSVKGIGDSVRYGMAKGAAIMGSAPPEIDFQSAKAYLEELSQDLSKLEASGQAEFLWGGLYLTAACDSNLQVFNLSGAQLLQAHTFEVDSSCAPTDATYVFNIDGRITGMSGMSLQSLANIADKVVFNFYQAEELRLQYIGVEGSVLAPMATVSNPQGVIRGHLFAKSWNGSMQINNVPFSGQLSGINTDKADICSLYPLTVDLNSLPAEGDSVTLYPGVNQGNFIWLSWNGSVKQSALVNSLFPPGNASEYVNPYDPQDKLLELGDWVNSVPGVKNSRAMRQAMNRLLNQEITIPVWTNRQGAGANRLYKVGALAKVVITNYALNGKGYLRLRYLGEGSCGAEPPVAEDQEVTTNEDQSTVFTLIASGEYTDEAQFLVTQEPQFGTIVQNSEELTYTPNANFNGQDSLHFKVIDGDLESNEATVNIIVAPVNDVPSANDQALTVSEDQALAITLTALDSDADTLTYTLINQPTNGVLSGEAPALIYMPNANFHGKDAFVFTVSDGQEQSQQATISIAVTPVNDPPTAQSLTLALDEDSSADVVLQGADIDGDSLTFVVVDAPAHGTLSGEVPNLSYQPQENFNGLDSFTYLVNDGTQDSTIVTVSMTIQPVNDAPMLQGEPTFSTPEGLSYTYSASAIDVDGDSLTYRLDVAPEAMTIDPVSGLIAWTPSAEYTQSVAEANSQCYTTHIGDVSVDGEVSTETRLINHSDLRLGSILLEPGAGGVYQLSTALSNRGLEDVTAPVDVYFYVGSPELGNLLGIQRQTALAAGETSRVGISVFPHLLTGDIYVSMSVSSVVEECDVRNNQARAALVELAVMDPGNLVDNRLFTLNVEDVNSTPVIVSEAELSHQAGQYFNFQIEAEDADAGDARTYTLISGPEGLSIDSRTGRLTADIDGLAAGDYQIVVEVEDLRGATTQQTLTLSIAENLPPTIISTPVVMGDANLRYEYDVDATDPNEGDTLLFSLLDSPEGMDIDRKNGLINWIGSELYLDNRADENLNCASDPVEDLRALEPVIKWEWPIPGEVIPHSEYNQVMHAPIAVPLQDTNGNGKLDEDDDIAIIFQAFRKSGYQYSGFLRAISAKDGKHIWTAETVRPYPLRSLAAADLDGDGTTEIVIIDIQGKLSALSYQGELLWQADTYEQAQWGGPAIADLDQDGSPDIILGRALYDNKGNLKWLGKDRYGSNPQGENHSGPLTYAADIDLDGDMELVAGPTIYDHTGKRIITNGEGTSALGNFDDDDYPEIVNVLDGYLSLYNHDGSLIWKDKKIVGGGNGGPPLVADLDGDGIPEIGVAGSSRYTVFNANGDIVWSQPTRDKSSGKTGSSAFDFNDDGRMEIVYGDEYYLRVYDGVSGEVIYEIENVSVTAYEYPLVVDVDHDGHAEIVAASNSFNDPVNPGIRVIEDTSDSWVGTRSIWNQHAYSVSNINDDMTVPLNPDKSWLKYNTFRANAYPDRPASGLADLTVHGFKIDEAAGTVAVTVKNRGRASVTSDFTLKVSLQSSDGETRELGSQAISGLSLGASVTVPFTVDVSTLSGDLIAELVVPEGVSECLTGNNSVHAAVVRVSAKDQAGLHDSQTYALSMQKQNTAPVITSSSVLETTVGENTGLQVTVSDPDRGDSHEFELIDPPSNIFVGKYSGRLSVKNPIEGNYTITIRVTDLAGASTEQVITLIVSPPDNLPPVFTTTPNTSAKEDFKYEYQANAVDPEGDTVTYALSRKQDGMTIDSTTGLVKWTPLYRHVGVKSAEISAIDSKGAVTKQYFVIDVAIGFIYNDAPRIKSIPDGSAYAGQLYEYQVLVSDPDNDTDFTYKLLESAEGMKISDSGFFTWLPSSDWVGRSAEALIEVHDGKGGYAEQRLTLPVNESVNSPPVITSSPVQTAAVGIPYEYTLTAEDNDGDSFSYFLTDGPVGLSLFNNRITWLPEFSQAAQLFPVNVMVKDSRGSASTQTFSIAVGDLSGANSRPWILGETSVIAIAGQPFRYTISAVDADGDSLSYQLLSGPPGMSQVGDSAIIEWLPDVSMSNTVQTMTVQVTDSLGAWTQQKFTINVSDESGDPDSGTGSGNGLEPILLNRPKADAYVSQLYKYTIQAIDADGYAVANMELIEAPTGMELQMDSGAGRLRWTPTQDQVGVHYFTLRLTDYHGVTKEETFTVLVYPERKLNRRRCVFCDSANFCSPVDSL